MPFACFTALRAGRLLCAELQMCDKCLQLDEKVEHYRRVKSRINDQLANEGLEKLIEEMLAQKIALHPEQKQ